MNKDLTPSADVGLRLQLVLQAASPLQLTASRSGALSRRGNRGGDRGDRARGFVQFA